MPWHSSGYRVNGELHLRALFLELVSQLLHEVLRLRERHPVAWDNNHRLSCRENLFVGGADRFWLSWFVDGALLSLCGIGSNGTSSSVSRYGACTGWCGDVVDVLQIGRASCM